MSFSPSNADSHCLQSNHSVQTRAKSLTTTNRLLEEVEVGKRRADALYVFSGVIHRSNIFRHHKNDGGKGVAHSRVGDHNVADVSHTTSTEKNDDNEDANTEDYGTWDEVSQVG